MKTETELLPCPFCGNPPVKNFRKDFNSIDCQTGRCVNPSTGSWLEEKDAISAWNRRPLPAPQPGGGGEAEDKPTNVSEEVYQRAQQGLDAAHERISATPPIALPVRAEGSTYHASHSGIVWTTQIKDRSDAVIFTLQTGSKLAAEANSAYLVDVLNSAAALSRELNRQSDIAEKQLHKAASLETQIAALSRELEEAKAERDGLKQQIGWHEEANADHRRWVRHLDVLWNGEAGAAKQAALIDVVAQIERELTALRAAPRSEGTVITQHFCPECPEEKARGIHMMPFEQLADTLVCSNCGRKYRSVLVSDLPCLESDKREREQLKALLFPEGLTYEPDLFLAVSTHLRLMREKIVKLESLSPRSETEGRDKERLDWLEKWMGEKWHNYIRRPDKDYEWTLTEGDREENPIIAEAKTLRAVIDAAAALAHDEKGAGE